MSLSEKSDVELSQLLSQYGIRHGPIVDSTRKLYEKKLEAAMENVPAEPSSDKTYYREEEEEVTYITYHNPVRQETDVLKRRGNFEPDEDEESDQETERPVQMTHRAANHSAVRSDVRSDVRPRQQAKTSGGCCWRLFRLLLLFAVLAAALYYAYCHLMPVEEEGEAPGKLQ